MSKVLTKEEILKINELYQNGKSLNSLAIENDINYDSLKLTLLTNGYKLRDWKRPEKLTDELISKVISLNKQGNSLDKLSRELNINIKTLKIGLLQLDVPYIDYKEHLYTEEQVEKLKLLLNEGQTLLYIQKELKTTFETLKKNMDRLGLVQNQQKTIFTEENLEKVKELFNQGLTVVDISISIGFSTDTTSKALKHLNLKVNKQRSLTNDEIELIKTKLSQGASKTNISFLLKMTMDVFKRECQKNNIILN